MEVRIKLPKPLIIGCYALCRQAERSVDRVLGGAAWSDFAAYYHEEIEALEQVLTQLMGALPEQALQHLPPSREEVVPNPTFLKSVGAILGKLVGARRESWAFSCRDVSFLIASLQSLVSLLGEKRRPGQDTLIQLRMDMYACQELIHCRCQGLRELKKADRIEHFLYPEHLTAVKIGDLLPKTDLSRRIN